jgi:O-antigen ligase
MSRTIPMLDKINIVALFVFAGATMFSISIAQIAAGIGGVAWFCKMQLTKSWKEQSWFLGFPVVFYLLACLVSVANAHDTNYSYPELKKILEWLIFFWVVNCVPDNKTRDLLSTLLIISATFASIYGFYELFNISGKISEWDTNAPGYRIEGTMSVYMTFAGLLMIAGMVAIGKVLFKRPKENWIWGAIIIIFACMLLTLTRQAWFGSIMGIGFICFVWKKKYFVALVAIFASLIFLALGPMKSQFKSALITKGNTGIEAIKFRLGSMIDLSGEHNTFKMRLELWKVGWEITKDYPLTGCGFKCVDKIHSKYPDPTGIVARLRGMHNNYIQLAVDTGILGLSAWIGIWLCFFRLLYMHEKMRHDSSSKWLSCGSASAVVAFLFAGFFESNLYDSEVVMLLYFVMALPFAGSDKKYFLTRKY